MLTQDRLMEVWQTWRAERSSEARRHLVETLLPLCRGALGGIQLRRNGPEYDEMLSIAVLALIDWIDRFDTERYHLGAFLSSAKVLVCYRVIDWLRSETRRQKDTIEFDELRDFHDNRRPPRIALDWESFHECLTPMESRCFKLCVQQSYGLQATSEIVGLGVSSVSRIVTRSIRKIARKYFDEDSIHPFQRWVRKKGRRRD